MSHHYEAPSTKRRRLEDDDDVSVAETSFRSPTRIPLDEVPADIVSYMLYYLPSVIVTRISLASKRWSCEIFDYQHVLNVPTSSMFGTVLTLQRFVMRPFSRIRTVILSSKDSDIVSPEIIRALAYLPLLRSLLLGDRFAEEDFLNALIGDGPMKHYRNYSEQITTKLTSLELSQSSCHSGTLHTLLQMCPNLVDVALPNSHESWFTSNHIDALLSHPRIPVEISLFWAISYRRDDKVHEVLDTRSSINFDLPYRDTTPFCLAVHKCTYDTIFKMLQMGASVNTYNPKGKTALHIAAKDKLTRIVSLLIEHGASVNAEVCRGALREAGMTALHLACVPRSARSWGLAFPVVQALLKAGARVDARDVDGVTPLMAMGGQYQDGEDPEPVLQVLLDAGADVNAINHEGKSPLMYAAEIGNTRLIALLARNGADVNQRCRPEASPKCFNPHSEMRSGATALHFANELDMHGILRVLIDLGADTNVVSDIGWTPLHEACWRGSLDAVQLLLANMKRYPKPTGNSSVTEWIPSEGRRVARDSRNPLFIAAQFSDVTIVEAILAKTDLRKYVNEKCYGLTPLEIASLLKRADVCAVLRQFADQDVGTFEELYEKVLDAGRPAACTFTLTGRHFAAQHYWTCADHGGRRGSPNNNINNDFGRNVHDHGKYICATCVEQCHAGHKATYGGILLTFCRCGSSPLRNCKASPNHYHI